MYVGDGEWDLEAAAKLRWGFIGIGDRLKGKTDVWIEDFFLNIGNRRLTWRCSETYINPRELKTEDKK